MLELAKLLKNEVFETVEIPGLPRIKSIKASENWVIIDNHYFYKPLSAKFSVICTSARQHYVQSGHYTSIDGGDVSDINVSFWDGKEPQVTRTVSECVCSLLGQMDSDPYANRVNISHKAFKKVWGDRPYKELLKTDMKQLKQQWLYALKHV